MPLSLEQKSLALKSNGYDPSKFEVDDTGNVFEKPPSSLQPTISESPVSPLSTGMSQDVSSDKPLTTFGKSAATSALPAAGAGLGTAGMIGLGSWALGPEIGLPTSLILGLIGALGGGYGARKLQNAVVPKNIQENVALSEQQNPKSALLGSLATMPLGGFNPSPGNVIGAARSIPKLLTGLSRTPQEVQQLLNVGLGTGIGAAQPIAESLATQGELPNIKDILLGAATGALFNKPNRIGKMLGFHSGEPARTTPDIRETQPSGLGQPLTTGVEPIINPVDQRLQSLTEAASGQLSTMPNRVDKMAKYKGDLFPKEDELSRMEAEGGPIKKEVEPKTTGIDPSEVIFEHVQLNQRVAELARQNQALKDNLAKIDQLHAAKPVEPVTPIKSTGNKLPGESTTRYSEESAIPLDKEKFAATHPSVRALIDKAAVDAADTRINPKDNLEAYKTMLANAEEIQNVLTKQVDWSNHPEIKAALENRSFDYLDPEHWNQLSRLHDAALAKVGAPKVEPKTPVTPTVKKPVDDVVSKPVSDTQIVGGKKIHAVFGEEASPKEVTDNNYVKRLNVKLQLKPNMSTAEIRAEINTWPKDVQSRFYKHYAEVKSNPTKYSESANKEQPQTELQKHVNDRLTEMGISGKPTEAWSKMYQDAGIIHRNAIVLEDGSIVNKDTGRPIAGSATFDVATKKHIVKINPDKAALDTHAHELAGHVFLDQLRNSPHAKDKAFVTRFEKLVNELPEFKSINEHRIKVGDKPWDAEEFIATQQGLEAVRRNVNVDSESSFKTYWKDLWSHIKIKYGKEGNATEEDYRRLLQYRFQNDPAYHDYFKTGVKMTSPLISKSSDETKESAKSLLNIKERLDNPLDEFDKENKRHGYLNHRFETALKDGLISQKEYYAIKSAKQGEEWPDNLIEERLKMFPDKDITHYSDKSAIDTLKEEQRKTDIARYHSLTDEAMSSLKEKKMPSQEILKEIENIKNKYGGAPPDRTDYENLNQKTKYSEEPSIKRQPGEGERPAYPFSSKEFEKGSEFNDSFTEYAKTSPMLPHVTHSQDNEAQSFLHPERNSDEPAIKERSSFLPILTSRFDKIQEKLKNTESAKTGNLVTQGLHRYAGEADLLSGQIGNKLVAALKDYTPEQISRVYRYAHQMDDTGSSIINLDGKELKLSKEIFSQLRSVREMQNTLGLKVRAGENYRAGGIKPEGYMFNVLDPSVAYEWAEKPNSVKSKEYDQKYIQHQLNHGVTPEAAKELLLDYKKALGNNVAQDIEFGALRKPEGNGLPWDLVDKNFSSAAQRYGRRAAHDLAYYKWIQNDPKMLYALSLKDQYGKLPKQEDAPGVDYIGGESAVKDSMRSIFGIDKPRSLTLNAAARAVNNTLMGVGTAARNILQMPAFVAQYVQGAQLPLVAKAITKLNDTRVRAFENNAIRPNFQDFDAAGYYLGSPNPAIRLLNRYSEVMRRFQGRDLGDRFEGHFYYSLGELLATDNIARAKLGNKESLRFVKRFGDIVEGGSESLLKRNITQDDISRVAKRFVDATRGTFGPEGLPSGAIEGDLAPFLSLSRWSIEKSNTIWKDVIEPARQGIYGPMIRYILGSAGVGLAVEQLNELLSNKRGVEPTVNEVLASGDKKALLSKAIATFQLAGFAGIIGDGAQLVNGMARNKGMKYNNPLSYPLYTWATDTMATNISQAADAIKNGDDPFEVLGQLAVSISTQSVQTMRYADAHFLHPEEAKRKEKFRDYNIWQELTDRKDSDMSGLTANPYKDIGSKQFKKEEDLGEVVKEVPKLIKKAIEKATVGSFINPEKLKAELEKLKQNSYQTMPSPDTMPLGFFDYLNHLRRTQGEEAANNRLVDYLKKREVNKVKSSLIPSI